MTEVTVKKWVHRGIMFINAECLDIDDPDHVYNQIKAQGQRPEDYGYNHPYTEEFGHMSRDELIEEVMSLRKEVHYWMKLV